MFNCSTSFGGVFLQQREVGGGVGVIVGGSWIELLGLPLDAWYARLIMLGSKSLRLVASLNEQPPPHLQLN